MMKNWKHLTSLLFLTFFVYQIHLTVTNQQSWPFCNYSMFNRTTPKKWTRLRILLKTEDGRTQLNEIHETLPLEFFKAIGVYYTVYEDLSDKVRFHFAEYIVGLLNKKSWSGFDEVFSPAKSSYGNRFVGFELAEYEFDFSHFPENKNVTSEKKHVLFRYKMD